VLTEYIQLIVYLLFTLLLFKSSVHIVMPSVCAYVWSVTGDTGGVKGKLTESVTCTLCRSWWASEVDASWIRTKDRRRCSSVAAAAATS